METTGTNRLKGETPSLCSPSYFSLPFCSVPSLLGQVYLVIIYTLLTLYVICDLGPASWQVSPSLVMQQTSWKHPSVSFLPSNQEGPSVMELLAMAWIYPGQPGPRRSSSSLSKTKTSDLI